MKLNNIPMSRTEINKILSAIDIKEIKGTLPDYVTGITQDSKSVKPGYIFFARSGVKINGLDFANDAAKAGATMIVTTSPLPENLPLPAIRIAHERNGLLILSHLIYNFPSKSLILIGVTGTNGKTSSVHLIRSIIETAGHKCGMISTIGYWTGQRFISPQLTTPDIDCICELLREMVDNGCQYAVMEVSSHALDQGRVEGLDYKVAAHTNVSLDHLDYHLTFEAYVLAKIKLFKMLANNSIAVINIGDTWSEHFVKAAKGRIITYRKVNNYNECDSISIKLKTIHCDATGGVYRLTGLGYDFTVHTPLIGEFQGENIALAASVALGLGFEPPTIIEGVEALKGVPGRMEPVSLGQPFTVLVDFCHTPDALERALRTIRNLRPQSLSVVFGCGGDRDKTKRPKMGLIAAQNADKVIITSDNPRYESPQAICEEILKGIPEEFKHKVRVIIDRRQAIYQIISEAKSSEIIILAGKGAETTIEVKGVKTPFDDRLVAKEALTELKSINKNSG